jgi:hypothetical protein
VELQQPQRQLDAIAELHRETITGFCPACLEPAPCATYTLATERPS